MTPFFILLYIIYFASSVTQGDNDKVLQQCNGYQANYNITDIIGTWFVIALVPDKGFPRLRQISCYKMDVSETDEVSFQL